MKFKVGDRVYSTKYKVLGTVVVTGNPAHPFPIEVSFDDRTTIDYTANGNEYSDRNHDYETDDAIIHAPKLARYLAGDFDEV